MAAAADRQALNSILCNAGAGAAAGVIAATFVCPLDVIKTRLQVHGLPNLPHRNFRGGVIFASLRQIFYTDGLRGMYRGLFPTILVLLPNWAVYFSTYEEMKSWLSSDDKSKPLSLGANVIAAASAGATTTVATNPLWVIKTRFQTRGWKTTTKAYKGTLSALRRIAHEEGFRGLYSGLVPALAGVSHVAIQFPVYEKIKSDLAKRERATFLHAMYVVIASSVSKIFASTLTYPHEVVRSKLPVQGFHSENGYLGVVDCVRKIYLQEGIQGFYRGCAANLLRTTPSSVITFTSFEMINRFLVGSFRNDSQPQTLFD